jgi:hypothetical protein
MNFPWLSPTENSELCHSLTASSNSLSSVLPPLWLLSLTNSKFRTLSLTYIAEGLTLTNSKHILCDPYPLLLRDITTHVQLTDTQETHVMWRPPTVDVWHHRSYANCRTHGKHSLLYCCRHVSCLQSCCLATHWSNMLQTLIVLGWWLVTFRISLFVSYSCQLIMK